MTRRKDYWHRLSRRNFLGTMGWAPALLLPAPIRTWTFRQEFSPNAGEQSANLAFADVRLNPHFPTKSPLDEILRKVAPGTDGFVTEKYAAEISQLLGEWSQGLKRDAPSLNHVAAFSADKIAAHSWEPAEENNIRSGYGIEIFRRRFAPPHSSSREQFLSNIKNYFASIPRIETAELQIIEITEIAAGVPAVRAAIRYDFVAALQNGAREERIGQWHTEWAKDSSGAWRASRWELGEETLSRIREPMFTDITSRALGGAESYRAQMLHGVDHWRTMFDGASGIDVYGNNGIAAGDFDNDGRDDLYVCQPSGLPNRLYRNRGDGTFEDVTEKSGVAVLDGTACAFSRILKIKVCRICW